MTDFKTHIKKQEQELHKNLGLINTEYLKIGTIAFESNIEMNENSEYTKIFKRCIECNTQMQSLSQSINEVKGLDEQLKDRKTGITKRNQDIKTMQLDLQKIYEDTGAKLFDLYTSSPQHYLSYDSRFIELDTLYRERFKLESDSVHSASTNFVNKLLQQGKKHVALGKLKKLELKSQNLFREIAQKIHESWTADPHDDPKVQTLISPISDQLEKIAELNKIVARHKTEISEIHSKKIELAQNKTPDIYFKKLNKDHAELEKNLHKEFTQLGTILYESNTVPKKLKGTIESLNNLINANKKTSEFIQKLKAAQKILQLSEEESRLIQREVKIQQQIDALNKQHAEIKAASEKLRKEIMEQENIQGSRESLIAQIRSTSQTD